MNRREFFKLADTPPAAEAKAPSTRTKADWKELAEHYKRVAEAGRDIIRREDERKKKERQRAAKELEAPERNLCQDIEDVAITLVAGGFALALETLNEVLKAVAGKDNDLSPHTEMAKERLEKAANKMKDHGAKD